jgi:hypothetical protein
MLNESDAALGLAWTLTRSAPLEGKHGGPICQGTREVTLSGASRKAILDVLQVHACSLLNPFPITSLLSIHNAPHGAQCKCGKPRVHTRLVSSENHYRRKGVFDSE